MSNTSAQNDNTISRPSHFPTIPRIDSQESMDSSTSSEPTRIEEPIARRYLAGSQGSSSAQALCLGLQLTEVGRNWRGQDIHNQKERLDGLLFNNNASDDIAVTSERMGSDMRGYGGWGMRHSGLAGRLTSRLGRRRLEEWGTGTRPGVVYAHDGGSETDDGGGNGLTRTVLVRIGERTRAWDVVRTGERFVVRVAGWQSMDEGCVTTRVDGRTRVHARGEGGFTRVEERMGFVVDQHAGGVFTVGVGIRAEGRTILSEEIRWRVGALGRSAAVLLRLGWYFFLADAGSVRLFASTDTPERVRLVARRIADGAIDQRFSASLTYVVLRVAAD